MERKCDNCGVIFKALRNRRLCDECDELNDPNLTTVLFEILIPEKDDEGIDKPKKIGYMCLSDNKRIYFHQSTLTVGDPHEYFNSYMYLLVNIEFRMKILNNKVETGKKYDVYRMGCKKCKRILLSLSSNLKYCADCADMQNTENKRLSKKRIKKRYKLTEQEIDELNRRGYEPFDHNLSPGLGTGGLGQHMDQDPEKELKKTQNEFRNIGLRKKY